MQGLATGSSRRYRRRFQPPVSLAELIELGWEPADPPTPQCMVLGPILTAITQAMTEVGWDQADPERLVRTIAETITQADVRSSQLTGWRRVLEQVDPPACPSGPRACYWSSCPDGPVWSNGSGPRGMKCTMSSRSSS